MKGNNLIARQSKLAKKYHAHLPLKLRMFN
jgi:hypothetical protein